MENFDIQPFFLYWGMLGALVGSAVTPHIFNRRNRDPWIGATVGTVVGIISAECFGWLLLQALYPILPSAAPWISLAGIFVLLGPLWMFVKPQEQSGLKTADNFVAGVISPMVIYLAVLAVLPIIWAIFLAFFEYSPLNVGGPILGFGGANPFVGLQHFRDMIEGGTREARTFHVSLRNTLIFAIAILPINLLITLPLAAMIEATYGRAKTIFRTIYFLPVVTSSVGVAIMWQFIYDAQYGLLNTTIKALGGQSVVWLHDPTAEFLGVSVALWAVIIAYVWQDYGYNLVIFIAAMQSIPDTLKEAARVDGASPFQVFWYVTLPLLRPTLLLVCILTMISSFQVFDIIQVMTQGGPGRLGLTRVLVLDIYENAFQFGQMGWAAAIALVLFILVLIVTVIQMRVLRSDWEY